MFSDEATFCDNGNVNKHNLHYWARENPHWMRSVPFQRPWSLNIWCGVIGTRIIGPYFFERRLTGPIYAEFIIHILPQLLEDVPLNVRLAMWMQHDGALPHYARCSRQVMDELFPEMWIGRGNRVNWPTRSPDLTLLDFFLWGCIKEKVMASPPTRTENMKYKIYEACAEVTLDILISVQQNFTRRINKCLQVQGDHFEHLI